MPDEELNNGIQKESVEDLMKQLEDLEKEEKPTEVTPKHIPTPEVTPEPAISPEKEQELLKEAEDTHTFLEELNVQLSEEVDIRERLGDAAPIPSAEVPETQLQFPPHEEITNEKTQVDQKEETQEVLPTLSELERDQIVVPLESGRTMIMTQEEFKQKTVKDASGKIKIKHDSGIWKADKADQRRDTLDDIIKSQLKASGDDSKDQEAANLLNYYKPQGIVNKKGNLILRNERYDKKQFTNEDEDRGLDLNTDRIPIMSDEGKFDHISTTRSNLVLISHNIKDENLDYRPIYIEERAFEMLSEDKGPKKAISLLIEDENVINEYKERARKELEEKDEELKNTIENPSAREKVLQERLRHMSYKTHRLKPNERLLTNNKGTVRASLEELVSLRDKKLRSRDRAIRRLHRQILGRTIYMGKTTGDRDIDLMTYHESIPMESVYKELTFHEIISEILLPLLKELQYLYENYGIIHRDLKPDNLAYTKESGLKILDFGTARLSKQASVVTQEQIIGTPQYMSPEQVKGKDLDFRCDLYSTGKTMYTLHTGELPFPGITSGEQALFCLMSGKKPYALSRPRFRSIIRRDLETPTSLIEKVTKPFKIIGRNIEVRNYLTFLSRLIQHHKENRHKSYQEAVEDAEAVNEGKAPPHTMEYLGKLKENPSLYKKFHKNEDISRIHKPWGFIEKGFETGTEIISEEAKIAEELTKRTYRRYIAAATLSGIVLSRGCEALIKYLSQ